jgi:hypothetical protein
MNNTLSGQLFFFVLIGVALVLASVQLGGQFDFIAEIRDQVNYQA